MRLDLSASAAVDFTAEHAVASETPWFRAKTKMTFARDDYRSSDTVDPSKPRIVHFYGRIIGDRANQDVVVRKEDWSQSQGFPDDPPHWTVMYLSDSVRMNDAAAKKYLVTQRGTGGKPLLADQKAADDTYERIKTKASY